ncbi:MAG: hypothetical protein ACLP81_07045, partial [Acidimicrobiales bacterium]
MTTTEREFDVLEQTFGKFDPKLSDGSAPHPRAADMAREESAILDHRARQRRAEVVEHFERHGPSFPRDPHPRTQFEIAEELGFAEARQRRELLAARGTEILRPGAPWPDERPQRRDPPPADYAPLGEWTVKDILRDARDRCLIAADNGREVVRHYYSPTTGLHVGTALSINAEPGARADLAQLVAVDIPYLTISLSGV